MFVRQLASISYFHKTMSSRMCIEIESQIYIRIQWYIAKLGNGIEHTEQP
jgi:hypothetical protein